MAATHTAKQALSRPPGETGFSAFKLEVVRIEDGAVAEVTTLNQDVVASFSMPATIDR